MRKDYPLRVIGVMVDEVLTQLSRRFGTAGRDAALIMMERLPGTQSLTVAGDKGFDTFGFVEECRHLRVTPHLARNLERRGGSAIDGRTTRHLGYAVSQRKRKRIEECCGCLKTIALHAEASTSWGMQSALDLYPRLRRLQSGAHAEPGHPQLRRR